MAGRAARAAGSEVALGGPEDPAADAAAAYQLSRRDDGGGSDGGGERPKGVLLAIAIVLLWLAAFCFFIAFEGQKLLGEQADTTGGGLLKAMITGLATRARQQDQEGT